uniref:Uncharacterized protein n=1 Tax=Stegastes partitus TaxID=144197 RepID=A0A3B4YVC8_9TELE
MTLQLRTKARLFDLHCSVALTDWDMDQELKLATTSDQFYHGDRTPSSSTEEHTFVKPNLWLLVNPNIACPIQYREASGDLCEADEGTKAETRRPPAADLHVFAANDASLQEELLQTTEDASRRPAKNRRKGRTPKPRVRTLCTTFLHKTLKPGCWPRPPVNYSILIALTICSWFDTVLFVQQDFEEDPLWTLSPLGPQQHCGWPGICGVEKLLAQQNTLHLERSPKLLQAVKTPMLVLLFFFSFFFPVICFLTNH